MRKREERVTLPDGLVFDEGGLLPVVVQDRASGRLGDFDKSLC